MLYYVMKTGLATFDCCRAYGLAVVLDRLCTSSDKAPRVQIEDMGAWFQLAGLDLSQLPPEASWGAFEDLLEISDGWCGVLLTTGRTPNESRLSRPGRKNVLDKIELVRKVLQRYPAQLNFYRSPSLCDMRVSAAQGYHSIPASLDASAVKGVRRQKLNVSTVGDQLYVPEDDWALALLGGAVSIRWVWSRGDYCALLPEPKNMSIRDHLAACAMERTGYLSGAAPRVAAAHYSIRLLRSLRRARADDNNADSKYGAMIFQNMAFAGNQWKSRLSGSFPMESLRAIQDAAPDAAHRLLGVWDALFMWAGADGSGALELALADFLGDPSLAGLGRYVRAHAAAAIRDGQTAPPYQAHWFRVLLPLLGETCFTEIFDDPHLSRVGRALQMFAAEGGDATAVVELLHAERLARTLDQFIRKYEVYARSRYSAGLPALYLRVEDTDRAADLARAWQGAANLVATALLAHTLIR